MFTACLDDDNEVTCIDPFQGALETEEEFYVGVWKLTALSGSEEVDLTDDGAINPSADLYAQLSECQQLTNYIFDADRRARFFAGTDQGDGCEETILFDGTWQFLDGTLSLNAECALLELLVTPDPEAMSFSFESFETVTDYKGIAIPMTLVYTYAKVP